MGWGSAFSSAYAAASSAAKSVVHSAAQTASTAWDYTRQKASEHYDAASQKAAAASQKVQQAVGSAAQWVGENKDAAVAFTKETTAKTSDAVSEAFGKIGDAFSGQSPGAPAATCPYANTNCLPPPPARGNGIYQPPPPCIVNPLTVICGHNKDRGFLLVPPNTATNRAYEQVIQVIADENDHDRITVDFSAGACSRGCGANWPMMQFNGHESKSKLEVKVAAPPSPQLATPIGNSEIGIPVPALQFPFADFASTFFKPCNADECRTYSGTVLCGSGQDMSFQVQAFRKREWSGEISASVEISRNEDWSENPQHLAQAFSIDRRIGRSVPKSGLEYSKSRAKLKISGELKGAYGVRNISLKPPSIEIGQSKAGFIPGSDYAFHKTKVWLDRIYPAITLFRESRYVTIEPEWPNVKFGGGMKAVEVKGRYNVAWGGNASLSMEPMFGLKGTFDALQWLIDFACKVYLSPAVGPFVADQIKYIREEAEKGVGRVKAVARIDITAKGTIGGKLEWNYRPEQSNQSSGELGGDLDITVEGKVSGEIRVMRIGYEAGATISGESGLRGKVTASFAADEMSIAGEAVFKGLKIKAMAFMSMGGSSVGNDKEGKATINDRKKQKKKGFFDFLQWDDAEVKDSADWEMVIIEEVTMIGAKGSAQFGNGGGGARFEGSGATGTVPLASGL